MSREKPILSSYEHGAVRTPPAKKTAPSFNVGNSYLYSRETVGYYVARALRYDDDSSIGRFESDFIYKERGEKTTNVVYFR